MDEKNPPQEIKAPETELKTQETPLKNVLPPMRTIIIKTDGNRAIIEKAEVAGNLELISILQELISFIKGK
jgi:hypothetical protein